jgi:hypothetical protein
MTTVGWIFMALSWGSILGLLIFCFSKVLRIRKANIQAPLEIEIKD